MSQPPLSSVADAGMTPAGVLERRRDGGGHGVVRFVSAEEGARAEIADLRGLVVVVPQAAPGDRGRLGEAVEEAIERELHALGAAAPGLGSASDADATLSDQLFRARRVGISRLCIAIGPLASTASPRGALAPEDGATLRFLATATRERPVSLLLHEANADLAAYADPIPLIDALAGKPIGTRAVASDVACDPPACPDAPVMLTPEPPVTTDPTPTEPAQASVLDEHWRHWMLQLSAARGPQSLAGFERLFWGAYMPLANAIAGGLADPRAIEAHAEFKRAFQKAYSDASPTFPITGKRPRMVLDAPEIAGRIARLHGARATQLLLVDSMRWDIGAAIRDRVAALLGARASLADETILWAALPTNTARQMDALARGLEALRSEPKADDAGDGAEPLRGRTAEIIRRIKIGRRDVYKLDLLEARLREADALDSLPELADGVAAVIARHAESLAPRTLLFVFGDHGFSVSRPPRARGPHETTTKHAPAHAAHAAHGCGGASPEEVLVPAFAFLVGDVH